MKIQFLGAAGTVTGSKYLITTEHQKILIDCGLFQGFKELRLRNWSALPTNPAEIDAVLLSHAHIDHSGYIPLLVKNGFKGKIYCTEATRDLCAILLPDSGYLQEEEAYYANKRDYSKHKPALPLYTRADAELSLQYFKPLPFNKPFTFSNKELTFSFHYAGHILGAASIRIAGFGTSVLFSGDLGRPKDLLMLPPDPPPTSDYIVVESTYGDRVHEQSDPLIQMASIINETVSRGGMILVLSFAVGRAQEILYLIHQLKKQHKIADIPLFIDSPMATSATEIFLQQAQQHRLSAEETLAVCATAKYVRKQEDSIAIDEIKTPMILISASGMATGGRVLHHLRQFASDPRNTILFAGYQAGGTRGDRMVRGEKEVKIFGEMIPIRAQVVQMHSMSAHADSGEIIHWLKQATQSPKKVFITHGEQTSAQSLKETIETQLGWNCEVPQYMQEESLV